MSKLINREPGSRLLIFWRKIGKVSTDDGRFPVHWSGLVFWELLRIL